MRSFQMIGVELPFPGKANFHDTLSTVQAIGYFPVEVLLLPVGPRQLGQSAAKTRGAVARTEITEIQSANERLI